MRQRRSEDFSMCPTSSPEPTTHLCRAKRTGGVAGQNEPKVSLAKTNPRCRSPKRTQAIAQQNQPKASPYKTNLDVLSFQQSLQPVTAALAFTPPGIPPPPEFLPPNSSTPRGNLTS